MKLYKRIAKKIARRFRKKGTRRVWQFGSPETAAQKLIANNWNITFSNPPAPRAGTKRRIACEAKQRRKQA